MKQDMKNRLPYIICITLILSSTQSFSSENINVLSEQTDELYRVGAAAQDGAYTSLGFSMLGWGLGIAAGIGILASVLTQSTSSSSHESCNMHDY